ncbi:MAG: DUF72 domain-containing protein [Saprospiraceae bacterium]|nr:DUF72 domain-containing protein [Saprospiraceae bacterium]
MKYGHAEQEELDGLSFDLPPDHALSLTRKETREASDVFQVYTGCGKWGIKGWIGSVYPEGTKQKDFLSAYLQTFASIELNGTFYRLSRSSIEKWRAAAEGTDFLFCPKWSQRISHFKRLNEVEENVEYFMDSMAMLGPNLGDSFLTLPPNFGPKHLERVLHFIELIPQDYSMHLEFRHADWFEEETFGTLAQALKKRGLGLVITDVALRRDALHMCPTSSNVFIRFNGYGLHASDYSRLDDWVVRLGEWKTNGIKKVFFFMHQQDENHTPILCHYFAKKMKDRYGMDIPTPDLDTP